MLDNLLRTYRAEKTTFQADQSGLFFPFLLKGRPNTLFSSLCFSKPKFSLHLAKSLIQSWMRTPAHRPSLLALTTVQVWIFSNSIPIRWWPHDQHPGQSGTVPKGQRTRINKVILVKKSWVRGQGRKGRKANKRTHNKGGRLGRRQNKEPRTWTKKVRRCPRFGAQAFSECAVHHCICTK